MGADGKMDVHLDVSTTGYAGRLEVLEGPTGRRVRSEAEKARIAAESLMPGAAGGGGGAQARRDALAGLRLAASPSQRGDWHCRKAWRRRSRRWWWKKLGASADDAASESRWRSWRS